MAKVLFVDDIPSEILPIMDRLKSRGHCTDIRTSEGEFRKFRKEQIESYSVVVFDISIYEAQDPYVVGTSAGIRLLRYCKQELRIKDNVTRFIIYTVDDDRKIEDAVRSLGAEHVLKGADVDLVKVIQKYVPAS